MDLTDEIKFGDLQKEERYKKLQRNLKLARMKQANLIKEAEFNLREKFKTNFNLKGSGIIQSSPWPSCSSINADPSDFNNTLTSLQTSRTSSEVLTSCFHLRNLINKRPTFHKPMATSSVKQFSETEQKTDDRTVMPPPSSSNIIRPPSKRSASADPVPLSIQSRQPPLFNDDLSSRGKQSYSDINSISDYQTNVGGAQDPNREKSVVRDFYHWRVFLNDQGQLLIKGALDNGKIARSKPVLRMLSSSKVESIFRHTYCLHGNLVDDKNELPKYVYSKFYSGFPDDWENVHQVWKNYVAQGSRENYRWPMDVSLSDDDLNSEITDISDVHKTFEKKFQVSNSMDKSTPQRSSGYSSDIQQERNSKSNENSSRDINLKEQSHFFKRNDNTVEVLNPSKEKENRSQIENRNQFENSNDRSCGNLYAALNYAQTLKDIIFEDKLTIITQTLLHENCPREYVRSVNNMIESLNYLLSYKVGELDESAIKRPRIESKNDSHLEDFQKHCSAPLFKPDAAILNVSQKFPDSEVIEKRSSFEVEKRREKYETNSQVVTPQMINPNMNSDTSESETYAGVPKIPTDRILQSKSCHLRYKGKKFDRNLKSNKMKLNTGDCQNNLASDLTVSFTEEEIQKSYEDDKESKTKSNSNTVQVRLNTSNASGAQTDGFNEKDSNSDPLRQSRENGNRAPLGALRKVYFDENRTRVENANKIPSLSDNEKRKTLSDKENMESNNQPGLPEALQRRETQNLQNLDLSDEGKQKPMIISSEIVNLMYRPKRPPKNQFSTYESDDNRQEQKEKEERSNNAVLKTAIGFQDSDKSAPGNIQENLGNNSFGSEKNPRPLESWVPLVIFDGKGYHLVFEGILLNAVGRPMKKKFTSSYVVRRVSSKVIETADHQFYKLVGDLHNTKHVVPKELLSQCRNGCPAKIDQFCAIWLKLTGESNVVVERSQKSTAELPKNVPSSSRGRKILPPLSFWADERIIRKDGNAVYKPGDPKDEFVTSAIDSPKKFRKAQDQETQADPFKERDKENGLKEFVKKSKTTPLNEDRHSSNEATKCSSNSEEAKRLAKSKTRIAHKLTFSSSDSEEIQEKMSTRIKRKSRKSLDYNESPLKTGKRFTRQNQNFRNSNPYELRKRQKIEVNTDIESDDSIPGEKVEKKKLPEKSRTSQVIRCTYHREVPNKNATLSDDQASIA